MDAASRYSASAISGVTRPEGKRSGRGALVPAPSGAGGNPLRPEAERSIRPHVDLTHVADGATANVFVAGARAVARVSLVAHLRDDAGFLLRLLRQRTRLLDRPAEGLLHVDVLVQIHGRERDDGMHVIRCRDHDRIDVLLLVEHLAIVAVSLQPRDLLAREAPERSRVVDTRPAGVGRHLRLRHGGLRRRLLRRARQTRRVVLHALQLCIDERVVDVADRHDVLTHEPTRVAAAHAPESDGGDVYRVAGRLEPAAKHMPGHNGQAGSRNGRCKERASRYVAHEISLQRTNSTPVRCPLPALKAPPKRPVSLTKSSEARA